MNLAMSVKDMPLKKSAYFETFYYVSFSGGHKKIAPL